LIPIGIITFHQTMVGSVWVKVLLLQFKPFFVLNHRDREITEIFLFDFAQNVVVAKQ
jgi:hypothetical protein